MRNLTDRRFNVLVMIFSGAAFFVLYKLIKIVFLNLILKTFYSNYLFNYKNITNQIKCYFVPDVAYYVALEPVRIFNKKYLIKT